MKRTPIKLGKDPIVDALAEIRFSTAVESGASKLLLGILFAKLREKYAVLEELPAAQLGPQLKSINANLKYVPEFKLTGEQGTILIGDSAVALSLPTPYPGWTKFKPLIMEIWECIKTSNLIKTIERISVRYVNLIEAPPSQDHIGLTDVDFRIGHRVVKAETAQLRAEFKKGNQIGVVQLITQATATPTGGNQAPKQGLVIDIDSIYQGPFDNFWGQSSDVLEAAHNYEKELFFEVLTEDTIQKYDPQY